MKIAIKRVQSPNLFEALPSASNLREAKNTIKRAQKQTCLDLTGLLKRLILIGVVFWGSVLPALSQKVVDKRVEVRGQKVRMDFKFADTVTLEAWDKNTIELHITANIDGNRYNDYYSLDVKEQNGRIDMIEHVDFEGIKKEKGSKNLSNFNTEINYKLMVPSDLEFDLNTISGKVELIGSKGKMSVNSVSGFIDYAIPQTHKARIDLSTVTGDVYSNVKFDQKDAGEISWVGTKCALSLNGGNIPVELKTVSGDIYLRKYQ